MLGNSDDGIRKCEAAKYSGWGKLQPSPLWRVKVTNRKGSTILDVAFLKFKDISKQISLKSLLWLWWKCTNSGLLFTHQNTIIEAETLICIKSHISRHQGAGSQGASGHICCNLGRCRCRHSWTLDRMWPLEALKREQASRVTMLTADIMLPLTAHCSPADTVMLP